MRYSGIVEALEKDGVYVSTTIGYSMWPMLRNRRDTIIIEPVKAPIKRLDVVLYQLEPDSYILHRVIGEKEEKWIIRGDNNLSKEWIDKNQILGRVVGFYRGEHYSSITSWRYRCYCYLWCNIPIVKYVGVFTARYWRAIKGRLRRIGNHLRKYLFNCNT